MAGSAAGTAKRRDPNVTGMAMAVHDLKGHLAVISGQARLLRSAKLGPITAVQEESLLDILAASKLIEDEIAAMLSAGVSPSEPWQPVLVGADLGPCLAQLHKSLQPEFHESGLRFDLHLPETPQIVPFDAHLVTRAVMNLLDNARRFTAPGGMVGIWVEPHFWERRNRNLVPNFERRRRDLRHQPNCVKVVVADTGCGIAPEQHQEIFDTYYSTAAPGANASSGLGLTIVRDIVKAHHGKIWVESEAGKGARFCFLLPFAPQANPAASTASPQETAR